MPLWESTSTALSVPPQWINNQIMASFDRVAHDTVGMNIIDAKAKELGKPLSSTLAKYIRSAAKLGLGNADMKDIKVIKEKLS